MAMTTKFENRDSSEKLVSLIEAERTRLHTLRQRSGAIVMQRIREQGRFAAPRVDVASSRGAYRRRELRIACVAALGVAATVGIMASWYLTLPPQDPAAEAMLRAQALFAPPNSDVPELANRAGVVEQAIDNAQPGSTLLVPVGTRVTATAAPVRIAKPLRIKSAG
jgi:hypothetical protein